MMFKKNDKYETIDQLIVNMESGNVSEFEASQKKFFLMMHQIANLKGPDIMENIINRMERMFTETDIDQLIDRSYDSLIDIDKFYGQKVKQGVIVETSHDVMSRADQLIDKIRTDPEYQNAIFVSHQGVIEPILEAKEE